MPPSATNTRAARAACFAPPSGSRGFALVPSTEPELRLLHRWLDCWRGVGDVVTGMARQGYDLGLHSYNGRGWRAVFFHRALNTR